MTLCRWTIALAFGLAAVSAAQAGEPVYKPVPPKRLYVAPKAPEDGGGAVLRITRKPTFVFGIIAANLILMDNETIADIRNGEVYEVTITPGVHRFQVVSPAVKIASKPITVLFQAGQSYHFTLEPEVDGAWWLQQRPADDAADPAKAE